jgi:anti-sigma-K factor RskA
VSAGTHLHDERRDDVAAYAVGGLARDERDELEGHLDDCEDCRTYLRWLQPAVDVLPASVEQLNPPKRLGAQLMETVRDDARRAQQAARERPEGSRWRSWRGLVLRPATGFAAAGAVIAGAFAGYVLHDPGDATEPSTVAATPTAAAKPGTVDAVLARGNDEAMLMVDRIPALPRDQVYEVWVQRESEMVPSGTFVPDRSGQASAVVRAGNLAGGDAVLVTAERRPEAAQPHSPPLLRAPLE